MYLIDYHIHTKFSPDGKSSIEEVLSAAQNSNLSEIAITDHCECNNNAAIPLEFERWFDFDTKKYTTALKNIKSDIPVRVGIELGQATENKDVANRIYNEYPWDFVLGSLHNLKGNYDFYYLTLQGIEARTFLPQYFEELYALAEYNLFSVLSHLYYPIKYIYTLGYSVDMTKYYDDISQIFKKIIENGKGIEVNTSALLSPYKKTVPNKEILKMYKNMGGEIITIGSDAHYSQNVGLGAEQTIEMLKSIGFKAITTYKKQKPFFVDI